MPDRLHTRKLLQSLVKTLVISLVWMNVTGQVTVLSTDTLPAELSFKTEFASWQLAKEELKMLKEKALSSGYLTFSYQWSSIIAPRDSIRTVKFHIGKRYDFNNVQIDSSLLVLGKDGRYLEREFKSDPERTVSELLESMDEQGFPFAKIRIERELNGSKEFVSRLFMDKGRQYAMDSIIIQSEVDVDYRAMQDLIDIQSGDVYNGRRLAEVDSKIKNSRFMRLDRPSEVIFTQSQARLFLFIKKKKANTIDAIVGFQPDAEGNVVFTGEIDLGLVNSFKRAEEIGFEWRRIQDNTQELRAEFVYPDLFHTPIGISSAFDLYRQDTTFTQNRLDIGLDFKFENGDILTAFLDSRAFRSLLAEQFSSTDLASDVLLYGLRINRDKRDDRFNPRSGYFMDLSISTGNKVLSSNTETNAELNGNERTQSEGAFDISWYRPIRSRSVIELAADGRFTANQVLLDKELIRIGGVKSLRGFDQQSIRVSSFAVLTAEYRFLLGSNSYLATFFDQAMYESNTIDGYINDAPYGFGAGFALATDGGLFKMSYALGSQFGNPIDMRTGKVHMSYSALF